jgi:ubiquinone/menaquinone biosynthesis C-methylase UbiE
MNIEEYAIRHPKTRGAFLLAETTARVKSLRPGSRVLDIGCAEGSTIGWLSQDISRTHRWFGVDLSFVRLSQARMKAIGSAYFLLATAGRLPLETGSIDFALASQVIEHVPDDSRMLEEIDRVLADGGGFQIDTVYKRKWARYIYRSPAGWALDPTHLREYTDVGQLIAKFPASLTIDEVKIVRSYRRLNLIPPFAFLPDWARIRIPGYFTLIILGTKV